MNLDIELFSEINHLSEKYQLYLRYIESSEEEIEKCAWILKVLYWQAGKQMEYLKKQIKDGDDSGESFSVLIGLAYSILDNLEVAADKAKIGVKDDYTKNGYIIKSETSFIKNKKIIWKVRERRD